MKIYLAAAAPGSEYKPLLNRLLSYFLIKRKKMECHEVFDQIKKENSHH